MTTLMVQTFLLLLTAFFAGATLACLLRRLIFGHRRTIAEEPATAAPVAEAPARPVAPAASARFEQALTGVGRAPSSAAATMPVIAPAPPAPPAPAAPAQHSNAFTPVVVGVAAAASAQRHEEMKAAAPVQVVEPAPPRIMLPPASGTTSGANVVAAEVVVAPMAPAVAPEPKAAPPPASDPAAPIAAPAAGPDDLLRIRGIDSELQARLGALGISSFAAIADWKSADVKNVSAELGLDGRIERENWIEQAQILAKGAETYFSSRRKQAAVSLASPPADEGRGPEAPAAIDPASVSAGPDRLVRIHGIDANIERQLNQWGVTRFAHITGWGAAEIERFETLLQRPGRIGKENWVGQAQVLAHMAPPDALQSSSSEARLRADPAAQSAKAFRPDLASLRSVRSEALRGSDTAGEIGRIGAAGRASNGIDDLKRIRGIGVLIEKKLNSLGYSSYEQVANWTRADIDRISQLLDFKGRIERENWVEQARILASGGQTEFSRRLERQEA